MGTKQKKALTDEQVERALYRLGEIEREKTALKKDAEDRIAETREDLRGAVKTIDKEAREIKADLKRTATGKRRSWEKSGRRSADYHHGRLGFRRSTSIQVPKDEAAFIAKLERAGMTHCVKIIKRPDLEQLDGYDDDTLRAVGAERITQDKFYAEPAKRTDPTVPGEA